MRKLIYSLIICLMAVTGKSSAQEGKSEYLFNDFQKSLIYYKDGRVFSVKVNYNLARNAFMFIDENDNNNIKLFAEPDMVRTLKIDNRIFQLDSKGLAQEHLNQEPYLAVTYRGKSRPVGKQVGYGGRSETASVDSYSSIQSGGHFQSSKQFLKLYPKEQEETIKAYIKSNKINFDEPQQVLQLVKYAEAL